jgi:hypothetical protein
MQMRGVRWRVFSVLPVALPGMNIRIRVCAARSIESVYHLLAPCLEMLRYVVGQVHNPLTVAILVVVPGYHFDERITHHRRQRCIHNA